MLFRSLRISILRALHSSRSRKASNFGPLLQAHRISFQWRIRCRFISEKFPSVVPIDFCMEHFFCVSASWARSTNTFMRGLCCVALENSEQQTPGSSKDQVESTSTRLGQPIRSQVAKIPHRKHCLNPVHTATHGRLT